jgi:hypothetical protein
MDQRDWELLDKQLRGPNPSRRNNGGMFFDGRRNVFRWYDLGRHPVRARE